MAVSERFQRGYRRLVSAFGVHQDAPRDPERVVELADARIQLEDRRTDMAEIRDDEGHPGFRPHNSEWLDPSIGLGSTGWGARLAGIFGALIILVGALAIVREVRSWGHGAELALEQTDTTVEELADGGCRWRARFRIVNESAELVRLEAVDVDARDKATGIAVAADVSGFADAAIQPGGWVSGLMVADLDACPVAVDRIRAEVRVRYRAGSGPVQLIDLGL